MAIDRILFIQDTILKQEPIQSSQLPSTQLQKIPAGTELVLKTFQIAGNNLDHYKIGLEDLQFKGLSNNWHAFAEHVEITENTFIEVPTVESIVAKQAQKNAVRVAVSRALVGNRQGFLKVVFNVDTLIKRKPVDGRVLNNESKQTIPAGTELILLTDKPDASNIVKLPIESGHVKFSLKDLEIKGFTKDWYAFAGHVGIQVVA
jgi:hypothetical protein